MILKQKVSSLSYRWSFLLFQNTFKLNGFPIFRFLPHESYSRKTMCAFNLISKYFYNINRNSEVVYENTSKDVHPGCPREILQCGTSLFWGPKDRLRRPFLVTM